MSNTYKPVTNRFAPHEVFLVKHNFLPQRLAEILHSGTIIWHGLICQADALAAANKTGRHASLCKHMKIDVVQFIRLDVA